MSDPYDAPARSTAHPAARKPRQSYANALPSRSMLVSPSKPPQTPTRALLERIRRRASVVPGDLPPRVSDNNVVLGGSGGSSSGLLSSRVFQRSDRSRLLDLGRLLLNLGGSRNLALGP